MNLVAILIGLGPLLGWGLFPTIAARIGGKPVNQILGSTAGTLLFAFIYNQLCHLGFPTGSNLVLAILSGMGWASAQIITFYTFTLVGSSKAMPITTAFQLMGASLWGVFALGNWPSVMDKVLGFSALVIIVFGAYLTVYAEHKTTSQQGTLKKAVLWLLVGELGYWLYSAAPQQATISGMQAFLPQAIGMFLVGVIYASAEKIRQPQTKIAFSQAVSYRQIISGFFFAFAALTYLISAQPNMNGLATGFILSQTSVVLATLTGIWFLGESKTKKEMILTIVGLALIMLAAVMTVI